MSKIIALLILGLMFILMFASAWNDSATMDELAHIPAGYSYLTQKDYRLNPEHPPLIKDLSAVPLLFLNLNFPADAPAWTTDINGQWDAGRIFLYEFGNDADKIIRWARLPIMLLALLFGWVLFKWVSRLYGNKVGLLTLFFYSMSPTIIAHSRYVTTDLAAAFGFFIGIATFVNFLKNQTKKNLAVAGIAFGIAQLMKFSLVILAPIYILLGILWIIINKWSIKSLLKIAANVIAVGLIGLFVIWPVYQFHVWNYPPERQFQDTNFILSSFGFRPVANFVIWLSDKPVLRAIGQYLFGVLMVVQRASGGNTAYFMGAVSSLASSFYFPLLYLLKEQLAFHLLTFIAVILGIRNILKTKEKNIKIAAEWMRDNFAVVASMIFIAIYFIQSITSNLNIGVRHILPALPFIFLLVARQTVKQKYFIVIPLLFLIFFSTFLSFPYYLSYYNVLGGGVKNGYRIATDSNYDWGQDLKRLKDFVENPPAGGHINKIAIDYFGGGNIKYYLGNKAELWQSSRGNPKNANIEWLAVSVNTLMTENSYQWLKEKKSVARAGTSIFIYKF